MNYSDKPIAAMASASTAPADVQQAAPSRNAAATTIVAVVVLMGVSGFAGLGYQIVWSQQFGVWQGHEMVAVLAVIAAFFGGLALGAHMLGRRIDASGHPAYWYAACEALIGGWGLLLTWLMPFANQWLASLTGPQPSDLWHWSVAFLGPFVLLLPATFAMGATLPAIEGVTGRLRSEGFAIGRLYAANTCGAVLGVLAAAFWLIPNLGLSNTALVCAVLNLSCALAALTLFASARSPRLPSPAGVQLPAGLQPCLYACSHAGHGRLPRLLFATGLLGIGYEVAVVRVLSQVTENTVYTFAVLLAVYLLATACGAAWYQRRLAQSSDSAALRNRLLYSLSIAMLAGLLMLSQSDHARALLSATLGAGFTAAIVVEAAIALLVFALPSLVMGMLFSHLCVEAKAAGWSFGSALGVNTLGAAIAPLLFGVLLYPWLGPKLVLTGIAVCYLALLPLPQWRRPIVWSPALAGLIVSAFAGPLAFVELPDGGRVLSYRDGVMAAVSVVEDAGGVSRLRINNRQQEGSSATGLADARQAYIPLLLHPAPHSALFLGLGTGVTSSAAAESPGLQVDVVELLPEVILASSYFKAAQGGQNIQPMPNVMAADARRYVRSTDKRYDVIVADLFHPARSGAGALYTVEHFAAIKSRLAPGGLFCQWLPVHQLDLATLRSIVHSFVTVYPGASAVLATNSLDTPVLGLIAQPDAAHVNLANVQQRLSVSSGAGRREALQLADGFSLLGGFVASPSSLARFGAASPLNTDDRPTVMHRAPHATYAPEALPRERLLALLHELQVRPEELLGEAGTPAESLWQQRLAAYWAARTRFLEVGMRVQPDPDPRVMLAQVQQPLLEIVRMSGDFRPAYDPLLRMALALMRVDVAQGRVLLTELVTAQPARHEARLALIDGNDPLARH